MLAHHRFRALKSLGYPRWGEPTSLQIDAYGSQRIPKKLMYISIVLRLLLHIRGKEKKYSRFLEISFSTFVTHQEKEESLW